MAENKSAGFWLGALVTLSVSIGVMLTFAARPLKAENEAKAMICRDMAEQVLAGAASSFDYMDTRCPARLLTVADDA